MAELVGMHLGGGGAGEGVRHEWEGFDPGCRDVSDDGGKGTEGLGMLGCRISPNPCPGAAPPLPTQVMHQTGETEARHGEEQPAAGLKAEG